jgi:phenylpropionate dioxygenase-like ring-hydroxylating dioxygenase large terminal subunit
MFTAEQNAKLVHVGPGTAMGELLRRFWMPALLAEELPEADCPPVRVRLLGEDLVAIRDTRDRIAIMDAYCPHRRAHLFFGRNEECGIRCSYHGWKFDVDGNCVDMPSEAEGSTYKDKVKLRSYPTRVAGGAVWVYMGPREEEPAFPELEWTSLPPGQVSAIKRRQQCNWAQAVEGGIDSAHISFVHRRLKDLRPGNDPENLHVQFSKLGNPKFTVKSTDYGLAIAAERRGEDQSYWRLTQFLLPFFSMIPTPLREQEDSSALVYQGHAWVPIDDENSWTWSFAVHPHRELTERERAQYGGKSGMWGPVDDDYEPMLNKGNDYKIDRQLQRDENFTGIVGIPNQDAAVQESMGPITDRSKEHLGHTDMAIIMFRRQLLLLADALAGGKAPEVLKHPELYRVRSASLLLPHGVDHLEGSAHLTNAAPLQASAAAE